MVKLTASTQPACSGPGNQAAERSKPRTRPGLRRQSRPWSGSPARDAAIRSSMSSRPRWNSASQRSSASPSRQAVHRRETPGINLIGWIKQLAWAVGVLECLPLPSRAGWAQAAENRIGGCRPRGFAAITRNGVGTGEGSVAWLRVPKGHGAGLQQQVTQQETVERAVGEQRLLIAEPSGQSGRSIASTQRSDLSGGVDR